MTEGDRRGQKATEGDRRRQKTTEGDIALLLKEIQQQKYTKSFELYIWNKSSLRISFIDYQGVKLTLNGTW